MLDPAGSTLARLLTTLGPGSELSTSGVGKVDAVQATGNLSHSFGDSCQFSGTYLYYTSSESGFGHYRDLLNTDENPAFGLGVYVLGRDVHAVALNNTFLPADGSVLTLRYGQTYFNDSFASPEFSADRIRGELGIQGSFLDKLHAQEGYAGQFPAVSVANFGENGRTHGANRSNNDVQWTSREISATRAAFAGDHTLKFGLQWRRLGLHAVSFDNGFSLEFAQKFTQGPDPTAPDTGSGSALADLLLGIPAGGSATIAQPADVFLDYFGGFVHDDWRPRPDLVLNLGLRAAHETGLREDDDGFAVGWDRTNPFPAQAAPGAGLEGALPGFPLRGGLLYAGVDGNPRRQWDPPAIKLGPRAGFAWTVTPNAVIRGGYAVFWAPYAIPAGISADSLGTYGFTAVTNVQTTLDGITPPEAAASNPFPHGIGDPVGNGNGRFQNVGARCS